MKRFLHWLLQMARTRGANSPAVNNQGSGNVIMQTTYTGGAYSPAVSNQGSGNFTTNISYLDDPRERLLSAHSLKYLADGDTFRFGVRLKQLFDEKIAPMTDDILGANTLLIGPPFVGKTCWGLRRAWQTGNKLGDSEMF